MTGRRLAPLTEVAGQITSNGGSALAVPAGVTDSQAMEAAVTAHEARFERLDIVVANVGIVPVPGPVLDCPSAARAAMPMMRASPPICSANLAFLVFATDTPNRLICIQISWRSSRRPSGVLHVLQGTSQAERQRGVRDVSGDKRRQRCSDVTR